MTPYSMAWVWVAFFAARLLLIDWACGRPSADLGIFYAHAETWLNGAVPYRDFPVEYPPGALLIVTLPGLLSGDFGFYRLLFYLLNLVADVAIVATLLSHDDGRGTVAAWLYIVASTAMLDVFIHRFDVWPTLVTLIGFRFWAAGKRPTAAALLSIGAAIKLWPALLLPLLFIESHRRGGVRESTRTLLAVGAGSAVIGLPFLLVCGWPLFRFLGAIASHGLLPESLYGSLLLVL
ncbi:MAG: DUF2029 domain-containing protein, partial [Myxococcales bacterium]|nr:DUF2029 domain-containing protein [Myxococcales bacterium]